MAFYEILIRGKDDGTIAGAHQIPWLADGTRPDGSPRWRVGDAAPLSVEAIEDIIGADLAALTAQVARADDLAAQNEALREQVEAAKQAEQAAAARADALQAALDAINTAEPEPTSLPAYAASVRYAKETGGATWNDWPIHTDAVSQTKYLAELQAITLGVRIDGDGWKFADGVFRSVSNADFPALATAARAHVHACFVREAEVLAGIAAGTITTRDEIDAAFASL